MSTELSRRSASITLYQGDDFERLAELRRAATFARHLADEAEKKGARRAGDDHADPDLQAAAVRAEAEYDAFVDEAAERAVEVRLRALQRKAFRKLLTDHPSREKNDDDAPFAVNVDTFPEALLMFDSPAGRTIEEPAHHAADRQAFLDDLADGDYDRLWQAAYLLNRAPGGDPKATRFSAGSLSSDET